MPRRIVSQRELAAAVGLTPKRIGALVAEGWPVRADKRIDFAQGEAWMAASLDPARRIAAGKTGEGMRTVADRRATKLDRESALLDLQLAQRRGELIERQAVEAAIFERG